MERELWLPESEDSSSVPHRNIMEVWPRIPMEVGAAVATIALSRKLQHTGSWARIFDSHGTGICRIPCAMCIHLHHLRSIGPRGAGDVNRMTANMQH